MKQRKTLMGVLSILVTSVLLVSLLTGCRKKEKGDNDSDDLDQTTTTTSLDEEKEATERTNEVTTEKTNDVTTEKTTKATETTKTVQEDGIIRIGPLTVPKDEKEAETTIEVSYKNYISVASGFLEAVVTNQYQGVLDTLASKDSPFVDIEDMKYAIPRSSFGELFMFAGESVTIEIDEEKIKKNSNTSVNVSFSIKNEKGKEYFSGIVELILNENNEWLVVQDNVLYKTDLIIKAPSNTTVTINSHLVSMDYFEKRDTGFTSLRMIYRIPYIGLQKKEMTVQCDNYTNTITAYAGDSFAGCNSLSVDEAQNAIDGFRDIYNKMSQDVENGATAEDLVKYISKDASPTLATDIYTALKGRDGKKFVMTTAVQWTDADAFYLSDTKMMLNIQCQIDYIDYFDSYSRIRSAIGLEKIDDEYKIYSTPYINVFQEDGIRRDW